jgi:hypothetical protein
VRWFQPEAKCPDRVSAPEQRRAYGGRNKQEVRQTMAGLKTLMRRGIVPPPLDCPLTALLITGPLALGVEGEQSIRLRMAA